MAKYHKCTKTKIGINKKNLEEIFIFQEKDDLFLKILKTL